MWPYWGAFSGFNLEVQKNSMIRQHQIAHFLTWSSIWPRFRIANKNKGINDDKHVPEKGISCHLGKITHNSLLHSLCQCTPARTTLGCHCRWKRFCVCKWTTVQFQSFILWGGTQRPLIVLILTLPGLIDDFRQKKRAVALQFSLFSGKT